jgi:hypothetical protein
VRSEFGYVVTTLRSRGRETVGVVVGGDVSEVEVRSGRQWDVGESHAKTPL